MSGVVDVVVLGSGPGGYVAAIRAAQLGLKTAIVERESLGGVCLNWGCIPTKALLRTSELYSTMKRASDFGLKIAGTGFDFDKVIARSRGVAEQLNQGVTGLLKKNKVAVHVGEGRLSGAHEVSVTKDGETTVLESRNIIIATGARARELPFIKADGKRIWTYRAAMIPKQLPEKLLVIGSGAIGIEFASFYNDMGADVTVVEMLDRILPMEDAEVGDFMRKALTKQGLKIRTSTVVESISESAKGLTVQLRDAAGASTAEAFTHAIVAIGIVPNTERLGLEAVGVATDRGHIVTDARCRTNVSGIYAIGDVAGAPWLAHKASHEGVLAAEVIAGEKTHAIDVRNIPACTYCHPQVASVGLTEAKAKEAGYTVRVGRFPFLGNGKATALGEAEGFIKTIFDQASGELLGAHMVGAEVTELIHGYTIGKTLETTEAELMATVFPHPTLSEMMHESVLSAFGRALHL